MQSGDDRAGEKLAEYELPWVQAHGRQAMQEALRDTEEAYQASLQNGDDLHSLTVEAKRQGQQIAAGKAREKERGKAEIAVKQRTWSLC